MKDWQATHIVVFISLLVPLNFMSNLLVILTISHTKTLASRTKNLYRCLSLSNCLMALLPQPMVAVLFTSFRDSNECLGEIITHFSFFLFQHVSTFMVLGIGIEKAMQAHNFTWYKSSLNRNQAIALVLFTGLIIFTVNIAYVFATIYNRFAYFNFALSFFFVFGTIAVLTALWKRKCKARKVIKTKKYKRFPGTYAMHDEQLEFKGSTTAVELMLSTSCVTIIFHIIAGLAKFNKGNDNDDTLSYMHYLSIAFVMLNSLIVALIILYENKQECKAFLSKKLNRSVRERNKKNRAIRMSDLAGY